MKIDKNNKTSLLVTTALLSALTLVCTMLLRIPVGPDCYIHLGDAVVILAVLILPRPYACFSGVVGATLADLIGGFAFWAPWTFIIKLFFVLILGLFIDISRKNTSDKNIFGVHYIEFIGLIVGGIIAILGYFISERILFGNWLPAATCIPFNLIQVTAGSIVAELIYRKATL